MKNTKAEIIKTAVALFNQKGFFKVTVKEIADEMGISPGNLTYHFKRKEHLLATIQKEILSGTKNIIAPEGQEITLAHFQEMFAHFFKVQREYSFYFSEIIYLLEVYPEITQEYKATTESRFHDARELVNYYIATGRLVLEEGEIDYNQMIHSLWMVNTFWTLGSALSNMEDISGDFKTPVPSLWRILFPYLTEKGISEYNEIKLKKKA